VATPITIGQEYTAAFCPHSAYFLSECLVGSTSVYVDPLGAGGNGLVSHGSNLRAFASSRANDLVLARESGMLTRF
jgi:hypothetical protein